MLSACVLRLARTKQRMPPNPLSDMSPKQAWNPLPKNKWDRAAARHLAARIGYSVHPKIVDEIFESGPQGYLQKTIGNAAPMPSLEVVDTMRAVELQVLEDRRNNVKTDRQKRKEIRQLTRETYSDYAQAWYEFAANPHNSPQEKLTSFFQNVWVVAYQGVSSVPKLFWYQNHIRTQLNATYPEMCLTLSRSQAMFTYLDLRRNRKGAPNENFARELFELFTLGEGHYTETDIKEAARALTGYGFNRDDEFILRPQHHDNSSKTIFGQQGRFDMESLIDLVFEQEAATRFLPSEFLKYYFSDQEIESEFLDSLAELWQNSGYSLPTLYETVFASEIFYDPRHRGTLIKSPEQFYLGLVQDLELDVSPLARDTVRPFRMMGQAFFNPPNVRGWPGGRAWINTATLTARRQIVEAALTGMGQRKLNADETQELAEAKAAGKTRFRLNTDQWSRQLDANIPAYQAVASRLLANAYPENFADGSSDAPARELPHHEILELLYLVMNSPDYQLC